MLLQRLDDYQTWLLTHGSTALLIDPWLSATTLRGSFNRNHLNNFMSAEQVPHLDGVVLCTHVPDHCRVESLALLHPATPVHGTPKAAKAARGIGMTSTHAYKVGDSFVVGTGQDALKFDVVKTGWPLSLLALAFVIEPVIGGTRIYFDPHLPSRSLASAVGHADAVVAPMRGVRAVVIPATAGPARVARSAAVVGASMIIPTALDPKRDMSWWQRIAYRGWGSVAAVQQCAGPSVRVLPEDQVLIDLDNLMTAN